MRRSALYASLPALALVALVLLGPDNATGQFLPPSGGGSGGGSSDGGASVTSDQVLAIVADAGTLAAFNRDVPGNTFIAANRTLDGGAGNYSFISLNDSCIKGGPGSSAEICFSGNTTSLNAGSVSLPTTNILQPACRSATSALWYCDPGYWAGFQSTSNTSGCAAGTAGGIKFRSTDSRHVGCDGTAVQTFGYTLSNTASVDFGSMADNGQDAQTMTVTGATTADAAFCSPLATPETGVGLHYVRVTAANTVTLVAHNNSGGTLDPAAINYKCVIVR